jgi:hypothetical protein
LNLQKTEEYLSLKVKRLSSLMKELGHPRLDLLKMDIEGAEYKVIESIIQDGIDIRVICVEYDECLSPLDEGRRMGSPGVMARMGSGLQISFFAAAQMGIRLPDFIFRHKGPTIGCCIAGEK